MTLLKTFKGLGTVIYLHEQTNSTINRIWNQMELNANVSAFGSTVINSIYQNIWITLILFSRLYNIMQHSVQLLVAVVIQKIE